MKKKLIAYICTKCDKICTNKKGTKLMTGTDLIILSILKPEQWDTSYTECESCKGEFGIKTFERGGLLWKN